MSEKIIKRICRVMLECAMESYYSLTNLSNHMSNSQDKKIKEYLSQNKVDKFLENMLTFSKDFKHHLQLGRSLMKQELNLDELDLVKINLKKKSEMLEMIDTLTHFLVGSKVQRKTSTNLGMNSAGFSSQSNDHLNINKVDKEVRVFSSQHVSNLFFQEVYDLKLTRPIGEQIKTSKYLETVNNKMILFNNEILKVNSTFCGKKQVFGSSIGSLIIRDKETGDQFVKTTHLKAKRAWVRTITKDKFGRYWVSTTNELVVYDKKFRLLKNFPAKQHVSYYGHLETFFLSADQDFGYWWNSRESIQVFAVRSLKYMHTIHNLVDGKKEFRIVQKFNI